MADNRDTSLMDLLKDQPPQEPRFDQNGGALPREEIKMLPEGVMRLPWREDERLKLSFPYEVSPGIDVEDEEEKEEEDEEEEIKVVPVAVTVAEKVKSIEEL